MNMIELQKQFQPKARNICSACGKDIGVSKLVVVGNVNICFECADLSKQLADKERKEIAEKEIKDMARLIEAHALKNDSAYISRFLYQAGYRKVE